MKKKIFTTFIASFLILTLSKPFTKKLGTADDYYLVFSKVEGDGWNITGSGGLSD